MQGSTAHKTPALIIHCRRQSIPLLPSVYTQHNDATFILKNREKNKLNAPRENYLRDQTRRRRRSRRLKSSVRYILTYCGCCDQLCTLRQSRTITCTADRAIFVFQPSGLLLFFHPRNIFLNHCFANNRTFGGRFIEKSKLQHQPQWDLNGARLTSVVNMAAVTRFASYL